MILPSIRDAFRPCRGDPTGQFAWVDAVPEELVEKLKPFGTTVIIGYYAYRVTTTGRKIVRVPAEEVAYRSPSLRPAPSEPTPAYKKGALKPRGTYAPIESYAGP